MGMPIARKMMLVAPAELFGVDGLYNEGPDRTVEAPLNVPYDVPANEFMNIEGQKFSKSRNQVFQSLVRSNLPEAKYGFVGIGYT